MKTKILTIILAALMLLFLSCAGYQKPASVCDDLTQASLLCEMAGRTPLTLETIRDTLIIANMVAIKNGEYTANDALKVVNSLLAMLDVGSTSYYSFWSELAYTFGKYGDMLIVVQSIISQFQNQYLFILAQDREFLRIALLSQRERLMAYMVNNEE